MILKGQALGSKDWQKCKSNLQNELPLHYNMFRWLNPCHSYQSIPILIWDRVIVALDAILRHWTVFCGTVWTRYLVCTNHAHVDCSNSSALAMELLQYCSRPSILYNKLFRWFSLMRRMSVTWIFNEKPKWLLIFIDLSLTEYVPVFLPQLCDTMINQYAVKWNQL